MANVILFDTELSHLNLLPLSFNRPLCDLRVGITTLRRKWEIMLGAECSCLPVEYLKEKYMTMPADTADCIFVAGNSLPGKMAENIVKALQRHECVVEEGFDPEAPDVEKVLAYRGSLQDFESRRFSHITLASDWRRIRHTFDIFLRNAEMIREDYVRLTAGRKSQPLDDSCRVVGPLTDNEGMPLIFIEEGAECLCSTFNTTGGPIYIGRDAQVMEGCHVRGPLAMGNNSKLRMGAKIYGGTTLGPYCKVGGEVDNVVMLGYSNKAHDGYLGNAVIGEWCNIGAGVNASNLKNDYTKIRVWNYATRSFMRTDLQFCGLIMGDHSKVGINAMFNTASVVGVGVNIHGSGYPRVFIPSFSEGSPAGGFSDVPLKKFYDIAERVMSRRGISFTDSDRRIYENVYSVAQSLKGRR